MKFKIGFLLAFIAGFVDTATFMGARGLFSAHVTGNFVLFAAAVVRGVESLDYLKVFAFVPFVLAVMLTARLSRVKWLEDKFDSYIYAASGALILLPAVFFWGVEKLPDELFDLSNFMIMLPVFAMGLQNAAQKISTPSEPVTTVMTGNVTQIVLSLVGYRREDGVTQQVHVEKSKSIFQVILGFAVGCVAAAYLVSLISLLALIVPALLMFGIALYTWKEKS